MVPGVALLSANLTDGEVLATALPGQDLKASSVSNSSVSNSLLLRHSASICHPYAAKHLLQIPSRPAV